MKRLFFIPMLFAPTILSAQIVISEVMYDPQGADTGREWIEVQNQGGEDVMFTTWKLFEEGVNHKISATNAVTTISAGGYGILVTDRTKFLADFPNVTTPIFDASFSLKNTGENLVLKDQNSATIDQYFYDVSLGGSDDGKSLQHLGSVWAAAAPTPGADNSAGSVSNPPPTATSTPDTTPGPTATSTGATTTPPVATSSPTTSGTPGDTGTQTLPTSAQFESRPGLLPPPQLYATIIGPKFVVAGVETTFEGKAFNKDKKEVGETAYGWNFGDGGTTVGMKAVHRYKYPGTYYIALDASAKDTTTVEYMTIQVIAPKMKVMPALDENETPYVLVLNQSVYDVDISSWILEQDGSFGSHFVIPKNTHVIAGGRIIFPSEVTKLSATSTAVALLFPNTRVADAYNPAMDSPSIDTPVPTAPADVQQKAIAKSTPIQKAEHAFVQHIENIQTTEAAEDVPDEVATSSSGQAAQAGAAIEGGNTSIWYAAVLGLIAIASGALWFLRAREATGESGATEYEVVEE